MISENKTKLATTNETTSIHMLEESCSKQLVPWRTRKRKSAKNDWSKEKSKEGNMSEKKKGLAAKSNDQSPSFGPPTISRIWNTNYALVLKICFIAILHFGDKIVHDGKI